MEDLKKRFSLDFLIGEPERSAPQRSAGSSPADQALDFVYGYPIIRHLGAAENQMMHAHDLAKVVKENIHIPDFKFNFQQFLAVLKNLTDSGFVQIAEEDDVTGNHLLRLGPMAGR